jgi:A/G-specific adenine glycosylase
VTTKKELQTLEHGFTHFRLQIRPLLCEVRKKPSLESPGRLWIDLADAAQAAVPTPVRTLLARLP